MPGVLHERVLDSFNHPRLIQLERRRAFLVVSILLRDGLMSLGEPGAWRYKRTNGALTTACWCLAFSAVQDGDVEAVGSRALESTTPLLRRFG